ncbi:MAG: hypothetical protein FWE80_01600 [Oscillospiraceae bacterium]|nr:hypothetical protein [Oscillospiraceae bacterium]
MANTIGELRAEYPDLTAQIESEAKAAAVAAAATAQEAAEIGAADAAMIAERERLKAIDDMSALFDSATVNDAKYGDNPCTAQEMAYRAAQKAMKQGAQFMAAASADTAASGAPSVAAAPGPEDTAGGGQENVEAAGKNAAAMYMKTMKGDHKDE